MTIYGIDWLQSGREELFDLGGVSCRQGLNDADGQLAGGLVSGEDDVTDNETQAAETLLAGSQRRADSQQPISCLGWTAGYSPQHGQGGGELVVPGGDGQQQQGRAGLVGRRESRTQVEDCG